MFDCRGGLLPVTICRGYSVVVAGTAVWCGGEWWLIPARLLGNNHILFLLMGQRAHPSLCMYLYDHLQIGRLSYYLPPNGPEALLEWCKAQRNRLCTQKFSPNCSSFPVSVPWYCLQCWLMLQKSRCSVSSSRTQMQEWPEHKWVLE